MSATLQPQLTPSEAMAKLVHHASQGKRNLGLEGPSNYVVVIIPTPGDNRLCKGMQSRWRMCIYDASHSLDRVVPGLHGGVGLGIRRKPPRQWPPSWRNCAAAVLVLASAVLD